MEEIRDNTDLSGGIRREVTQDNSFKEVVEDGTGTVSGADPSVTFPGDAVAADPLGELPEAASAAEPAEMFHESVLRPENPAPMQGNPESSAATPYGNPEPPAATPYVNPEPSVVPQSMSPEPSVVPGNVNPNTTGPDSKKPSKKKRSLKEWTPGPETPNHLTIARICMIPLFVILLLWVPKPAGNILAMIVFIIASLTDTADGYIARKYNYVSTFGKFMDPLADKLLVCSALICLVDLGRIESWIVIIIIAREFIISGFRLIAVEKGVVIAANIFGKLKTIAQMIMVILMVGNFGGFLGTITQFFKWIALLLTVISLATYLIQNRAVLKDGV